MPRTARRARARVGSGGMWSSLIEVEQTGRRAPAAGLDRLGRGRGTVHGRGLCNNFVTVVSGSIPLTQGSRSLRLLLRCSLTAPHSGFFHLVPDLLREQ